MSAPDRNSASQSSVPTSKLQDHDDKNKIDATTGASASTGAPNQPAMLEEDDEFEDFPVEDWPQEDSTDPAASSANGTAATSATTHLWEESWDDDEDGNEEFSKALKEELKQVEGTRS
ncbi:putative 26 proteasome complex subunit [Phaeomoniella chlamydospora]|uniref:26S proteasome complex subunit SEM1 n=1 Tax=Phaeomoniella chlamydospora TaxID=158046 RepID=A0A0G2ECK1_PHACM|nr:putative 26 proteasome complex subunit [Phaeomoniella chlamydospora]